MKIALVYDNNTAKVDWDYLHNFGIDILDNLNDVDEFWDTFLTVEDDEYEVFYRCAIAVEIPDDLDDWEESVEKFCKTKYTQNEFHVYKRRYSSMQEAFDSEVKWFFNEYGIDVTSMDVINFLDTKIYKLSDFEAFLNRNGNSSSEYKDSTHDFKVGDRAQYFGLCEPLKGKYCTIKRITDTCNSRTEVRVEFDGMVSYTNTYLDTLKPIQNDKESEDKMSLKVGDRIEYIGNDFPDRKYEKGTIRGMTNAGAAVVQYDKKVANKSWDDPYIPYGYCGIHDFENIRLLKEEVSTNPDNSNIKCKKEKENDNMSIMSGMNIFGKGFGVDNSGKFKMSIAGLAIKDKEGKFVCYDAANNTIIDVMDITFDINDVVFKIPTAEVNAGDVIIHQGEAVYVADITDDGIKVINPETGKKEELVHKVGVLGFNFYTKVISMFGSFGGGGIGNGTDGFNPLMLMAFAGKDSKSDGMGGMMEVMALSSIMGNGGTNPFTNMFGGLGAAAATTKPTARKKKTTKANDGDAE